MLSAAVLFTFIFQSIQIHLLLSATNYILAGTISETELWVYAELIISTKLIGSTTKKALR